MVAKIYVFVMLLFVTKNQAWRAVPAHQASLSGRRQIALEAKDRDDLDDLLPKDCIHSIYKFGWCMGGATSNKFHKRHVVVRFPTLDSTRADYLYLVEPKDTIRYRLQCVIMRIMVPRKYLFRRSRLPLSYCQGYIYYVMFDFVQRLEVHEMYIFHGVTMPAEIHFDFYQPQEL